MRHKAANSHNYILSHKYDATAWLHSDLVPWVQLPPFHYVSKAVSEETMETYM